MNLKNILPVFKVVLNRDRVGRKLAELAHGDEPDAKVARDWCAEDESARLNADDHVGLPELDRRAHRVDGGGVRLRVAQERGDITEDNPWLREVRDRADSCGELFWSHRASLREGGARRRRTQGGDHPPCEIPRCSGGQRPS